MKIFLTGATGHSGKWFIERLKKEKFDGELICLVREGRDISRLESSGLKYKILGGSAEDQDIVNPGMANVDILIHIAGIQISELIMRAAISNHVKWAVLVHTTGRFSKFKSASAEYTKIEESIIAMRDVIDITIVRPTMIYGSKSDVNMHKLIGYLDKHKFFPLFGRGDNLMQPVHARDLGNAYYDIVIHQGITKNKEYNLSGKYPLPYKDIIKITSKTLGRKNIIIEVPLWISIIAAKVYNAVFGVKAIITVEQVLRMQEDKDFSYEEASRDFGYDPISFEEGIREEIEGLKRPESE